MNQSRIHHFKHSNESHFYDIPSTKSQRSASFGFGKKVEIGGKNYKGPSAGTYEFKS